MSPSASADPIVVFVHLAHGFGAEKWQSRWSRGEIIGINERLPYGYFQAAEDGCIIEYSEDKAEGVLGRLIRLFVRFALGFDLVHAWRNRRGIGNAEVVWTHTESQHLAVLLLLRFLPRARRPKVIAQSIWLFDEWQYLSGLKRWLYRQLLSQADILTVHSPENLKLARKFFPRQRSEIVPFGIDLGRMRPARPRTIEGPVHILSLGNDRHRDWSALIGAVGNWDHCMLRIVSRGVGPELTRNVSNIEIARPQNNHELTALYEWADIVAIALKPNLHASGVTVIQEATLFGLPVVCTDTGGLAAYFRDGEVKFVRPGDPGAMRKQIAELAVDKDARLAMVEGARRRMVSDGLSSRRFAQRHAELSRELLGRGTADRRPAQTGAGAITAVLSLPVIFALPVHLSAAETGAQLHLCAYRPTFIESFHSLSVSPWGQNGSRWIAHTPWRGDFGEAAFTDPRPGFPFTVSHGILQIEARKDGAGKWQSGLLASSTPAASGFSQRFGYFEMRAQLPPGPGLWPAFWLNSVHPPGTKAPGVEIDVLEYYGQFPDAYHSTVHIWDHIKPGQKRTVDHVTKVPAGSLTTGFHRYGVDVAKDWITFYLDRKQTWRTPTLSSPNSSTITSKLRRSLFGRARSRSPPAK